MKRNQKFLVLGLMTAVVVVSLATLAFLLPQKSEAVTLADVGASIGLGSADLLETTLNIIRWVLGFLGLVAVIIIIYGGFIWMTAGGNQEKIQKAKKIILGAIIGLVIVLLSWAIVSFVIQVVTNSTGGGGQCIEGERNGCYECDASGNWFYNPLIEGCEGGLPGSDFAVSWVDPRDGETDVSLCRLVQAGFTDLLDDTTINDSNVLITVVGGNPAGGICTENKDCDSAQCDKGSETCQGSTVAGTFTVNANVFQFDPNVDWEKDTAYEIWIPTPGVKNTDGEDLVTESRTTFTTGTESDATPPQVDQVYPTGTDICLTDVIQATFNEPMNVLTLMDTDSLSTNPSPASGYNHSANPLMLSATHGDAWDPLTNYEATLHADVITDSCGNNLDGDGDGTYDGVPEDNYVWNFTTSDTTNFQCEPEITDIIPNSGYYDDQITVLGSNFKLAGDVIFSSNVYNNSQGMDTLNCFAPNFVPSQACVVSWGGNQIVVRNPAGGGASNGAINGPIRIEVDGESSNNSENLTVLSPHVNWISPSDGSQGQYVTVSGSNFGTVQGAVYFREQVNPNNITAAEFPCGGASWTDNQIIIRVPGGLSIQDYWIQVETSAPRRSNLIGFSYNTDPPGPGICEAVPSCGQVGDTPVVISGERFGADPGAGNRSTPSENVKYGSVQLADADVNSWSENTIDTTVPSGITLGNNPVKVTADGVESNAISFMSPCDGASCDLNPTTPQCEIGSCSGSQVCSSLAGCRCVTAPQLVTTNYCDPDVAPPDVPSPMPYFNAQNVCLNAEIHARFDVEMEDSTLNDSNIIVQRCNTGGGFNDSDCTTVINNLGISDFDDGLVNPGDGFRFTPDDGPPGLNLQSDTWYRVLLSTDITSAPPGSVQLRPNPSCDIDGTMYAYCWQFKTKTGSTACEVDSVSVLPDGATPPVTLYGSGLTQDYTATPVDADCTLLAGNYNWSWNSTDTSVATITGSTDETETATSQALGETWIQAFIDEGLPSEEIGQSRLYVNVCDASSDCTQAGECPQSICDDVLSVCTPSFTQADDFNPDSRAEGDLVTLMGCYFGSYSPSHSYVEFGGGARAPFPSTICQSTDWTPTEIVAEVPVGADDGNLVVGTAPFDLTVTSPNSFDVDNTLQAPNLCRVIPNHGRELTTVRYEGADFGGTQGANDYCVYTPLPGVRSINYTSWNDAYIDAEVPQGAQTDYTWVDKDGTRSNPKNFTIDASQCTTSICTIDGDCGDPNVEGCADDNCCASRPNVDIPNLNPGDGDTNVCLNSIIYVPFDTNMDTSTFTYGALPDNIIVREGGANVFDWNLSKSGTSFTLYPDGLLTPGTLYEIFVRGDNNLTDGTDQGVLSAQGVGMNGPDDSNLFVLDFTTTVSPDPCELDQVMVTPSLHIFTSNGQAETYEAQAYAQGQPIQPIPGVYDWTWEWKEDSGAGTIVSLAWTPAHENPEQAIATANANGNEIVTATAQSPGGDVSGSASAQVYFCENPWPNPPPWDDDNFPGGNQHFSTWYCRDAGDPGFGDDLPEVLASSIFRPFFDPLNETDELMEEVFFSFSGNDEAIGIRVMENTFRLSAEEWYQREFSENTGSPSNIVVDGWQGVKDGRTVYINAANSNGSSLFTNIYIISYSDNATAETLNIYGQMLDNWVMYVFNGVGPTEKTQIQRDIIRIFDIGDVAHFTNQYWENNGGRFPDLTAGTYLQNISTSKWPSWQATLGNALGEALANDPIQDSDPECTEPGYDLNACWNESNKIFNTNLFTYPDPDWDYHYYLYKQPTGRNQVDLYANLEYIDTGGLTGDWRNTPGSYEPCFSLTSHCRNFNYGVTVDPGGSCTQCIGYFCRYCVAE